MPEVRLIDANAAADKIMREAENHCDDLNIIGIALIVCFARMLRDENDFPTIEAEPVRHGRWNYRHEDDWCYCTACGTDAEGSDGECLLTDYCPHCGARMDERGADNG